MSSMKCLIMICSVSIFSCPSFPQLSSAAATLSSAFTTTNLISIIILIISNITIIIILVQVFAINGRMGGQRITGEKFVRESKSWETLFATYHSHCQQHHRHHHCTHPNYHNHNNHCNHHHHNQNSW